MYRPTNAIVLTPTTNEPGKKDVTGAFFPESKRFVQMLRSSGCQVREATVDNTRPLANRRTQSLEHLRQAAAMKPLDCIAFFCHGWRDGIQLGLTRKTLADFVKLNLSSDVLVALYCCSTGEDANARELGAPGIGDGSFADTLRDALCVAGKTRCRVVAHTTVAHTTKNPNVLLFDGMDSPVGGVGGIAPVTPKHPLWKSWRDALQVNPDFRFRFPLMTVAEMHTELIAG